MHPFFKRLCKIIAVLSTFYLATSTLHDHFPSARAEDRLGGQLLTAALVYREPDASSEVLGKLRQGMTFWINGDAQNGFYSITFPKPIKNSTVGWIRVSDVRTYRPSQSGVRSAGVSSNSKNSKSSERGSGESGQLLRNHFIFGGGMHSASPAAWQEAMGATAGSAGFLRFSAEFRRRNSPTFEWGLGVSYLNFSKPFTALSTSGTYFFNGLGAHIPVAFYFTESHPLSVAGVLSVGMSRNSAGNSNGSDQLTTSNIWNLEFEAKLEATYHFSKSMGILVEAGYFSSKMAGVPTLDMNAQQQPVDINLSSLGFGLGFSFEF